MNNEFERLTETVLAGSPADRPWEGCVNQVVYRVPRGIKVSIPRFLAEHIRRTDEEREEAERLSERLSSAARRLG
ncbi:MAG: hypothetical protein J5586_03295 [Clostridia bacterium]|nr:hypothetical protein [Clostridia bacterium]